MSRSPRVQVQDRVMADPGDTRAEPAFQLSHAGEVRAYLRQLQAAEVPVQLSTPQAHTLTATLHSVDERTGQLRFDVNAGALPLAALVEADELVGVAYLDKVKLQFDLAQALLVHSGERAVLQTAWPRVMYRFQRRQSFRVPTLARHAPVAHLRHPALPDMVVPLRVLDVSAGGCALRVGHDVPPLTPGCRVAGVRVELDAETRFSAGLLLQHVSAIIPGEHGVRIGCEWWNLEPAAARALQRYVDLTQKQQRLLSRS